MKTRQWIGQDKNRGFTIVELLIVIVVIGILAAISAVAYNGVQDKARMVAKESAINDIKKVYTLYAIKNGNFPTIDISNSNSHNVLRDIGLGGRDSVYIEGTDDWNYKKNAVSLGSREDWLQIIYWDDLNNKWIYYGWSDPNHWYEWSGEAGSESQPIF